MSAWVFVVLISFASGLTVGCAENARGWAERPPAWVAIVHFRSSAGDVVHSKEATFAWRMECERWVRRWARSDFWRVWRVSVPDCIPYRPVVAAAIPGAG
jgi:hypothetical protein